MDTLKNILSPLAFDHSLEPDLAHALIRCTGNIDAVLKCNQFLTDIVYHAAPPCIDLALIPSPHQIRQDIERFRILTRSSVQQQQQQQLRHKPVSVQSEYAYGELGQAIQSFLWSLGTEWRRGPTC